jgi:hypothetical protein
LLTEDVNEDEWQAERRWAFDCAEVCVSPSELEVPPDAVYP